MKFQQLEGASYYEEETYQRELLEIFQKTWLFVGHTNQLANIGDHLISDAANESLIVLRATDGSIKSYLNLCLRISAKMISGFGERDQGRKVLLRVQKIVV
jgi:phenylpropionate dioxygenase-like ring-hydroxylating dioxygenase large terminal subunit